MKSSDNPARSAPVAIFTFRSDAGRGLYAFAADRDGSALPERHGPWKLIEEIGAGKKTLPHEFDRDAVEEALAEQGFQMWRPKPGPDRAVKKPPPRNSRGSR